MLVFHWIRTDVLGGFGFKLGWNISTGWCFPARGKETVTPGRISVALQQVKCEGPSALKGPCSQPVPLQCVAAVASRALGRIHGQHSRCPCLLLSQAQQGYCEFSQIAPVNRMRQMPSPAALLIISTADKCYKAVQSLLLFWFPGSLCISAIPTAWTAAAAGTNRALKTP